MVPQQLGAGRGWTSTQFASFQKYLDSNMKVTDLKTAKVDDPMNKSQTKTPDEKGAETRA